MNPEARDYTQMKDKGVIPESIIQKHVFGIVDISWPTTQASL